MVYISPDGQVLQAKPWGLHSITDFFWGIIAFLQLFFRSLIDPNANSKGDNYSTQYRNTGGRGDLLVAAPGNVWEGLEEVRVLPVPHLLLPGEDEARDVTVILAEMT